MKRLETVGPKTINNEVLVLAAVLKNARLWQPLRESYEPLLVPKHGPGQALTPDKTAKLIETAQTNDRWFVALCATVLADAGRARSSNACRWNGSTLTYVPFSARLNRLQKFSIPLVGTLSRTYCSVWSTKSWMNPSTGRLR
jgi:hypothetical protein